MSEPIIEQIAEWISTALDSKSDPDGTITLRSVRPKILNWDDSALVHGDVIIELGQVETQSITNSSRFEKGTFLLHGMVSQLPADTKADTVLARMAETIRKEILEGNNDANPLGGLAISINCPEVLFLPVDGGVKVVVTCEVLYSTNIYDGFTQS